MNSDFKTNSFTSDSKAGGQQTVGKWKNEQ